MCTFDAEADANQSIYQNSFQKSHAGVFSLNDNQVSKRPINVDSFDCDIEKNQLTQDNQHIQNI